MTDHAPKAILTAVKDALSEFSEATTTLYVPRPQIQVGGEKWRILSKNMADQLRDHAPKATQSLEAIESMQLEDFRGEGVVFFEDDRGHYRTSHLNARPVATMVPKGRPFVLPLMRDIDGRLNAWVVALDLEAPKLYLYSGGSLIDHSHRIQADHSEVEVNYEEIKDRRDVAADIFFHNGSRGALRSSDARSKYHAAGTDAEAEREKTDDAYFELVIDGLQNGLPFQVRELIIMGAEKTVGRFCQIAEGDFGDGVALIQLHGGGEALEEGRIIERLQNYLPDIPTLPEVEGETDVAALEDACKIGRVATLYVSDTLAGIDLTSGEDSEHPRLRIVGEGYGEPIADALPYNDLVLDAVAQGAEIVFINAAFLEKPGVLGTMRWGTEGRLADPAPQTGQTQTGRTQAAE